MAVQFGESPYRDGSPEEAFAALGNETRLGIMYALWTGYDPLADDNALSFSELYDRVDYDTPGNFSYHLDQLVGQFVRKSDAGYSIALPGRTIVQALVAGWATEDPAIEPTDLNVDCPQCGGPSKFSYHSGAVRAHCPRCAETDNGTGEHQIAGAFRVLGFPPTGLDGRTPEETLQAACIFQFSRVQALLRGVCPTCASRVETRLEICEDHVQVDGRCRACGRDRRCVTQTFCNNCKAYANLSVSRAVQADPVVTAFYQDHDVEHEFASWEASRRAADYAEDVVSSDPARVRVTISHDYDELRLTVDEELNLVGTQ